MAQKKKRKKLSQEEIFLKAFKRQTEKSKWREMMGNGYAPIKFGKTKKHITEKEIESLILTISFVFIYMN